MEIFDEDYQKDLGHLGLDNAKEVMDIFYEEIIQKFDDKVMYKMGVITGLSLHIAKLAKKGLIGRGAVLEMVEKAINSTYDLEQDLTKVNIHIKVTKVDEVKS